jgi:hypothetical protein
MEELIEVIEKANIQKEIELEEIINIFAADL